MPDRISGCAAAIGWSVTHFAGDATSTGVGAWKTHQHRCGRRPSLPRSCWTSPRRAGEANIIDQLHGDVGICDGHVTNPKTLSAVFMVHH